MSPLKFKFNNIYDNVKLYTFDFYLTTCMYLLVYVYIDHLHVESTLDAIVWFSTKFICIKRSQPHFAKLWRTWWSNGLGDLWSLFISLFDMTPQNPRNDNAIILGILITHIARQKLVTGSPGTVYKRSFSWNAAYCSTCTAININRDHPD